MTDIHPRVQAAYFGQREEVTIATGPNGREGLSTGAMAKDMGVSPARLKRGLGDLGIEPDFVKTGCAYYYAERSDAVKKALAKSRDVFVRRRAQSTVDGDRRAGEVRTLEADGPPIVEIIADRLPMQESALEVPGDGLATTRGLLRGHRYATGPNVTRACGARLAIHVRA